MMKHSEFYCAIASSSLREKYEFLEFQRKYTQIFQNKCFENKTYGTRVVHWFQWSNDLRKDVRAPVSN